MKASIFAVAASAGVAAAWPRAQIPTVPVPTPSSQQSLSATAVPVHTVYSQQTLSASSVAVNTIYSQQTLSSQQAASSQQTLSATTVPVNTLYDYQTVSPTTGAVATVFGSAVGSTGVATYYSAEGSSGLVQPTYVSQTYYVPIQSVEITSTM